METNRRRGLLSSLLRLELQDAPLEAAVEIAKEREIKTEDLVDFYAKHLNLQIH